MNGSPVAARLVRAWVDLYTRGLPAVVRNSRRDEVADDLWCELEEAASLGRSANAVSSDISLRLLGGIPADITWRLSQRRTVPADALNRRSSMNTRALGLIALAAGLSWSVLIAAYVVNGESVWTGSLGGLTNLATLLGVIGFPLCSISLAIQVRDRLGALGVAGAFVAVIGAFALMAGTSVWLLALLLPLGSAILLWAVSDAGVVPRLVPIAQATTAVALAVEGVAGVALGSDGTARAVSALTFAPFLLSWVVLGVFLVRRPQPESVGRGSPA